MTGFLTVIGILLSALGPGLGFFGLVAPLLGAGLSAVGLVLLSLAFFLSFFTYMRYGARETSWLAFFLGLFALAAVGGAVGMHFVHPIKDITTDVRNPPKFLHPVYPFTVEKGAEYLDKSLQLNREYDPGDAALQLLAYPGFDGMSVKAPAKDAYATALQLVKTQQPDWRLVLDDAKNLHAEFEVEWSPWRFVDDLALEARTEPGKEFDSHIELRSRSRIGKGDFGLNRLRLRELKVRLTLELKKLEDKVALARTDFEKKTAEATTSPAGTSTSTSTGTATATTAPAKAVPGVPPPAPTPMPQLKQQPAQPAPPVAAPATAGQPGTPALPSALPAKDTKK